MTTRCLPATLAVYYVISVLFAIAPYQAHASAAPAPWYNSLWTKREIITVTGSTAGAQTNYPVKLTLPYAAGMKPDFSDLRFTDSGGAALLSYWMETEAHSSTAVVWVKVPSVPIAPDTTTVYAYYGNPNAVSLSNGDTTFTLFDTFGGGGTPGDWNYTNNMIGEHAIIHNGKLYAPLYDPDHGVNGGLAILNPITGAVIRHFTIPGYCIAAAPAFDKNGYVHIYDCGGFIKKLDENTGTVLRTLNIGGALDWEAVPYDPVNDIVLIASQNDHSLSAVRASDYSVAWTNSDVNLTYGSSEVDPPLIVGAYVYWQDYSGALFKISLSNGITAASTYATARGLPSSPYSFTSYSQIIYDSANNRLYLTNSTGHTAFAINPADLSVIWSKEVEGDGWNFNRGGAYRNNVWFVTAREAGYPFRSKIYALDTQNSGDILWTNTTAYDNGGEVSSVLADSNYVYAGTYDYAYQNYNRLLILNALDGTLTSAIPLMNGAASSIPTFFGGKIIMGLWYNISGQQVGGYQALQVRDGGGTDDFYYKADLYQTGYVGAFASGPSTVRTGCGYGSLDPTKWIVSGLSSITDCAGVSTVNVSSWANYFKSNLTFSRSNTAIRVRAKNSEPSSNDWDAYLGFTNVMSTCQPVCFGRNNGQAIFGYDQNGVLQITLGPAYSFDQYSTSEVKMAYPSIQFDINDSNIAGSTNWSTSFDQMPIQLGNFKGAATVDWVLVRKYVNPEPAVSIGVEISLSINKTHSGNFTQGQANATYTVMVSNAAGARPSSGTVTVIEAMPSGLTLVSMAGTGWTCPSGGTTCTRNDPLAGGSSYPTITVTVNVASNATSPLVNSVSVSGGGSAGTNTTDSTTIILNPVLSIGKTHSGNFTQGQANATYTVTVSNQAGAGPTSGTVTVMERLPTGLTATSMAGTGWNCTQPAGPCSRSDVLAAGSSYPSITVIVNVASDAPASVTNTATVSGGGQTNTSNNQAVDPTTIVTTPGPLLSLWSSSTVPATQWYNDAPATLGVKFRSDIGGSVTGIRFYKGAGNNGTHIGLLYSSTGTPLAQATFTSETAAGWQQVNFSSAVSIAANTTYIAAFFSTSGFALNQNYFTSSGVDNAPLHALRSGVDGLNGVYMYGGAPQFPSSTYADSNYWVDIAFSAAASTSLWSSSTVPAIPWYNDVPATLGVKFRSDVSGLVAGIRFYKGAGNNGTHIGLFYSSTGTLLAQATFTSETAAGWQQVNFSSAVSIAANTTYIAAFFSTSGFALNQNYFTSSGVDSAPLHALRSGVDGLNGVYMYGGAPQFPSSTYADSNYWVDVAFSAGGPPPTSLWSNSTVPSTPWYNDAPVTLGVKFRSDVSGLVTGIRFYRGTGNNGTHTGLLYSSTGTLLAQATFSGETASGWQQVNFSSPVPIAADTTYIAALFTTSGFAYSLNYFTSSGADSPPLHALRSGVDGPNGVYVYGGTPQFPSSTYSDANYWVDLLFN